ncbi:MAG: dihydroxyacetone kinase subunit DhaK [Ancalomicrobiaceae bacterium]|nr:dihydroxyacetone kinase subunit DhaK [Ancalomicrobiaceae bacterium]
MKKLINTPSETLKDFLNGFAAAYASVIAIDRQGRFVRRAEIRRDKVAIISGGGSGHEPLHVGFVGIGMLDAACPGQIFTSPTPDQILAAHAAVAGEPGALFLVKNYEGDQMNFDMAIEMLDAPIAKVVIDDDAGGAVSARSIGRRGVAGTFVVEKIVGAAAEARLDLDGCRRLAERTVARTRSMGVALSSCTVPLAGRPTFTLAEDEMEIGVGIHGEPGRERLPLGTSRSVAELLVDATLRALDTPDGADVLLFVNGFGGSPPMELYCLYGDARAALERRGCRVVRSLVGTYVTSLEMAGASVTVTLLDEDLARFWDAPALTPAFVR